MSEGGTHPAGVKHPFDTTCYFTSSFSTNSRNKKKSSPYWFMKTNFVLVILLWILCANLEGVKCENSDSAKYNFVHDHTNCNHRHPRPDEVRKKFIHFRILRVLYS